MSLSLGLLLVPGVALASPWSSPWSSPAGPPGRGDVCDRGEPPCHTTTTRPTTTTQPTTTTTRVSGTSATSTTTTTTQVSGTSATSTSTTTTAVSGTSATSSTTDPVTSATSTGPTTGQLTSTTTAAAVAPAGGRSVLGAASNERRALADTGATPALTALAGLATVLAGAGLLLFGRRRRGA
ncbi:LPXTG cell wall anchor domain-containing protein [Saccharothrix sp. MB29]|nr:LPXTG cell wall anchor domain-containing protein [Saccharothrix sp. MB29]